MSGFLERFDHVCVFGSVFKVGTTFQRKIHALFAVAVLGVVALGVCQEPVAFLGGVGEEGHAQIRVERFHGVVEYRKRVIGQVVHAFLGAAIVEAEVGIHLVGLAGHDSCEALPADVPKFVDGLVADALVGGGLGDHDEVVDDGVVGIGVFHVDSFGDWAEAAFWAVKNSKKTMEHPLMLIKRQNERVYICDYVVEPKAGTLGGVTLKGWVSKKAKEEDSNTLISTFTNIATPTVKT